MTEKDERGTGAGEESAEDVAARSRRMVEGLNAIAEAGIPVGDAVPHPEDSVDFSKWLDLRVKRADRGRVELTMRTRPEMSNPTGLLHGGVQAAIMDSAIGITCATLGYRGFPITIDFVCNYLGKIRIGSPLTVVGEVEREGSRIVHAHARILDDGGQVVAEGEANLLKTSHVPYYVKNTEDDTRAR